MHLINMLNGNMVKCSFLTFCQEYYILYCGVSFFNFRYKGKKNDKFQFCIGISHLILKFLCIYLTQNVI